MNINSKEVYMKFNLPNFKKEDIKVRLSNNSLTIKAQKSKKSKIEKKDFKHIEKSSQNFKYSTSLPRIDKQKAEIRFNKGILTIRAPRI